MATTPTVIEGTWEELLAMSPRFAGRRVRLTVLDESEPTPIERLQAELARLAAEVPPEAWDALPPDLTDRLDDYLRDQHVS